MKTLLPTLKENRRYIVYEVVGEAASKEGAAKAITESFATYVGTLGAAQAGVIMLPERWENNTGALSIGHKWVDHMKAAFTFITSVDGKTATVRSKKVSGTLKAATKKGRGKNQ